MIYEFADYFKKASRFCVACCYIENSANQGQPIPPAPFPVENATVTFIQYKDHTYAVTAAHVMDGFRKRILKPDPLDGLYLMAAPGIGLSGNFLQPKAKYLGKPIDLVLQRIEKTVVTTLKKEAFDISSNPYPAAFQTALALGYPTMEKNRIYLPEGTKLEMPCVAAFAECVTTGVGDQIQFFSEIDAWPTVCSLSGMSGGPVFWSKGDDVYGLIGIVKEAREDRRPNLDKPYVHFIAQAFSPETFGEWVEELYGD
jgi:hypothetical protein